MNNKYKEQIKYLMRKCELLEKMETDLRYELGKKNRKIEEVQKEIDILKFTGVFDQDRVQVTFTNGPALMLQDGRCILTGNRLDCKYLNYEGVIRIVHYNSEKKFSIDAEPELIDNYESFTIIKIKDRWFKLDKIQGIIVEIPAPAETSKASKKKSKKKIQITSGGSIK